jgi:hypothetical protein
LRLRRCFLGKLLSACKVGGKANQKAKGKWQKAKGGTR